LVSHKLFGLTSLLVIGIVAVATGAVFASAPTITLEKDVYFVSPSGDPVVVESGTYEVQAAEAWLRLIPQGRERAQSILLKANVLHLDAMLNTAKAESQQVGEDQHLLTLLLSDGTVLAAEGSYSGVRSRGLLQRRPVPPLLKPSVPQSVPPGPGASSGSPAQVSNPRIIIVTGPNENLVEALLGGVNCGNFSSFGISATQCEGVKTDLRQRLKGYGVRGTGTPGQRVDLYLAPGCPASQEFRTLVAAEVTASVKARLGLGSFAGAFANSVSLLFDGYWRANTNQFVGATGAFESLLIAPASAQGVNVATPAGSPCSNGYGFAQASPPTASPSTQPAAMESPPSAIRPPLPTQVSGPTITGITGPNAHLVEVLVGGVNCGNLTSLGISATRCDGVKADLRQRLKGYAVSGTGTPGQRVDLYLAPGCPAAQEFRTLVAAEVTASVRARLGPYAGAVAQLVSSQFDGYWRANTNDPVGETGAFESLLIAPASAQGVNVATPAGSPCSNEFALSQATRP
jgi:hypothetical protein